MEKKGIDPLSLIECQYVLQSIKHAGYEDRAAIEKVIVSIEHH